MEKSATATAAVLFCDVVNSTARQVRLGDTGSDDDRHRLFPLLESCVSVGGGEVVKTLGDGLMAVFERSTIGALECAVRMHATAALFDPQDPLELRVGISIGEVIEEDGDWFGTPVVEAARLCAVAGDSQTLAHALVASLVGSRGDHYAFRDDGVRTLKGLASPVPVVVLVGGTDSNDHPLGVPEVAQGDPVAPRSRTPGRSVVRSLVGSGVVVFALLGGATVWQLAGGSPENGPGGSTPGNGEVQGGSGRTVSEPIGYEPVVETVECGDGVKLNLPDARCGELVVPENREKSDRTDVIRVPFAFAPAVTPTDSDPVVMFGFSEHLNRSSLRENAGVYALSLRGYDHVGAHDAKCPDLATAWEHSFGLSSTNSSAADELVSAAGACADTLREQGFDPDGYNWQQVAADVRDLALAEGLDRVQVATEGSASLAAVSFAMSNPDLVGSLVLTNPVAPGSSYMAEVPRSTALELDQLNSLCESDPDCVATFGDLRSAFNIRALELTSDPVTVSTESLEGEGPFDVLIDGRRLGSALGVSLRATAQLGLIPLSMQGAAMELVAAVSINDPMKSAVGVSARPLADMSFRCSYDGRAAKLSSPISDSAAFIGGSYARVLAEMCDAWGVTARFDPLSAPLRTQVPVLVAEGGISAAGVHDWGEDLTRFEDSPVLLRFETMSDDLIYDPPVCLTEIRSAFIEDPDSVHGVAECERQSPPIEWVTGA